MPVSRPTRAAAAVVEPTPTSASTMRSAPASITSSAIATPAPTAVARLLDRHRVLDVDVSARPPQPGVGARPVSVVPVQRDLVDPDRHLGESGGHVDRRIAGDDAGSQPCRRVRRPGRHPVLGDAVVSREHHEADGGKRVRRVATLHARRARRRGRRAGRGLRSAARAGRVPRGPARRAPSSGRTMRATRASRSRSLNGSPSDYGLIDFMKPADPRRSCTSRNGSSRTSVTQTSRGAARTPPGPRRRRGGRPCAGPAAPVVRSPRRALRW